MMVAPKFQNKTNYASETFVTNFTFVKGPDFSLQMKFLIMNDIFLTNLKPL